MYNGFSLLKEYTAPLDPIGFEDESDDYAISADENDGEEYNDEEESCCESLQLGINGHDYVMEAAYGDYINNKIINENRLSDALSRYLILTESTSYKQKQAKLAALNEAGLTDKIKAKWNKFVKFIKNIFAKFMESMSNILYKEQDYLKKYQKIILNKRPKEDIEYSYTGNYEKGIQRITTLEIPDFDYARMKSDLLDKNDDNHNKFIRNFIKPNGYDYDDVESLADSFKRYFIAAEDGSQSGKLSDINMSNLYNFCFNYNKIEQVTSKDITHLEKCTNAVISAAQDARSSSESQTPGDDQQQESKEESALFMEAEDNNTSNDNNSNNNDKNKQTDTNLTLDVSKASGSIKDDQNAKEDKDAYAKNQAANVEKSDQGQTDLDLCVTNYMSVCRTIITAKWTAAEQIAKDYMAIIRAHVRSYVGNDKDTTDNISTKKGTKYNSKQGSDNKNKEAEQSDDDQGESTEQIIKNSKKDKK